MNLLNPILHLFYYIIIDQNIQAKTAGLSPPLKCVFRTLFDALNCVILVLHCLLENLIWNILGEFHHSGSKIMVGNG